jgi:hypothetical protein
MIIAPSAPIADSRLWPLLRFVMDGCISKRYQRPQDAPDKSGCINGLGGELTLGLLLHRVTKNDLRSTAQLPCPSEPLACTYVIRVRNKSTLGLLRCFLAHLGQPPRRSSVTPARVPELYRSCLAHFSADLFPVFNGPVIQDVPGLFLAHVRTLLRVHLYPPRMRKTTRMDARGEGARTRARPPKFGLACAFLRGGREADRKKSTPNPFRPSRTTCSNSEAAELGRIRRMVERW